MDRLTTRFTRDLEIPNGTRVPAGISTIGVLVLGEDCICDGDLYGLRGVLISRGTTVEGNVTSGGPVLIEQGARVFGEVRPYSQARPPAEAEEPTFPGRPASPERPQPTGVGEAQVGDRRESTRPQPFGQAFTRVESAELEMDRTAIKDTLTCLLLLALDTYRSRSSYAAGTWWGLPGDALKDTLDALRTPLAHLYDTEADEKEWSDDDIFDVLLPKVVPMVVPLALEKFGRHRAMITFGPPEDLPGDAGSQPGWPIPVLSLLSELGRAMNPNFKLVTGTGEQPSALESNPTSVTAWVSIGE